MSRARKSQDQKDALWSLYKRLNGLPPARDEIKMIGEEMGLKPAQIYKWFWDTKKKIEEDTVLAK